MTSPSSKSENRKSPSQKAPQAVLWTEKETSKYIGFDARTLQSWRMKGTGPRYVQISPRCIRYRPEDIDQWIKERLRRSTSDTGEG